MQRRSIIHRALSVCTTATIVGLMMFPQTANAAKPVAYRLAPGKTVGYTLKVQVVTPKSSEVISGVACFWGREGNDNVVTTKSRDNLIKYKSSNDIKLAFPTYNKMLKENFIVNEYGEPLTGMNGKLPMLLGDLEELFYPPLPKKGQMRSKTNNAYHRGDGEFSFYGMPDWLEDSYKGEFKWSTSFVRETGNVMHYVHRRKFATNDGKYQLIAQGPIEFDAGVGRLISHKLKGYCVYDGKPARFSIEVSRLTGKQLKKLVSQ